MQSVVTVYDWLKLQFEKLVPKSLTKPEFVPLLKPHVTEPVVKVNKITLT